MTAIFKMSKDLTPRGDQPEAIEFLTKGIESGQKHQTLLGVTGSGKTFTMANVIQKTDRPALVIAHNKTLAAQLYREFKQLFPENAVHYFVSYYDYYQPEAYLATTDTYIEKDSSINEELDRMRHAATKALFERRDVIIVASVSCIYGLGSPSDYTGLTLQLEAGQTISRRKLLEKLVELQFSRNDQVLMRKKFRVRGDTVEIFGVGDEDAVRVELFGDEIDKISRIDPLRNTILERIHRVQIFPASHYVTSSERWPQILNKIRTELDSRSEELDKEGKLLEKQRLLQRTYFDLEMLELTGYCAGIENYSRQLTGRNPGEAPPTLLDYMPENSVIFIDESHVTIPQLKAMYRGDRSRKSNLVNYGFRLPSALDNRPLMFEEFLKRIPSTVYVSATPADFEIQQSKSQIVEQIIRPTGLLDPKIKVFPAQGQVDHLFDEIKKRADIGERTLVTTLTKKMSESLAEYYQELGLKVKYLHSEVKTLDRIAIIRELRLGKFDALIGVNLLREGLDIPEVSLVGILDADQEGFLRSTTALIQTIGRCARNVKGQVILYADRITKSMKIAMDETNRRRKHQGEYNKIHGITPESIQKSTDSDAFAISNADYMDVPTGKKGDANLTVDEIDAQICKLEAEMRSLASELKFEDAANVRDRIKCLRKNLYTQFPTD